MDVPEIRDVFIVFLPSYSIKILLKDKKARCFSQHRAFVALFAEAAESLRNMRDTARSAANNHSVFSFANTASSLCSLPRINLIRDFVTTFPRQFVNNFSIFILFFSHFAIRLRFYLACCRIPSMSYGPPWLGIRKRWFTSTEKGKKGKP